MIQLFYININSQILRYYAHSYYHENEENVLSLHFHGFACKNSSPSKQYS